MEKLFTCFLIDDDLDDREIFLTALEQVAPSVRCYTASNGQEAIDKLASEEVQPDLIFVDLNMPLMNGKQFLKACHLVDACRNIPVIILTASSDRRSMEDARLLGARDYITKPDKLSAWGDIIKETLDVYHLAPLIH